MSNYFLNSGNGSLMAEVAAIIVENKAYLSEIDGKIGDGDHGVNMAKGFSRAAGKLQGEESFDQSLSVLSDVLMSEIGGSMGPLYGMFFSDMADKLQGEESIDAAIYATALSAGLKGVIEIGSAKVGDKTMLDCLVPAIEEFEQTMAGGGDFRSALKVQVTAAEKGRDSTIDLVAKVGRSSRLGERSRGVLDAGATSCCLILSTLATGIEARLG